MTCLSPGTKSEQSAYSHAMVRITCSVALRPEQGRLSDHPKVRKAPAGARSPVPNFDRVSGGGQDGQVVRAEGQRPHVCPMAAERQATRLVAGGLFVSGLQAVGLHGVVLQQQRHLQLATRARQTLRPSVWEERRSCFSFQINPIKGWRVWRRTDLILAEALMLVSLMISSFSVLFTAGAPASSPVSS